VLGIPTPAGGVLLHPVAPVGLRDRDAGTVSFTSSLGYWKKLERMERDPRIGLLFSDRSHGHTTDPLIVLLQGDVEIESQPDQDFLDELFGHHMPRFFGPTVRGPIWDRLTREYHRVRVRVTISLKRLTGWEPESGGIIEVAGESRPYGEPPEPAPPRAGVAPQVSVAKAARRASELRTACLGYIGRDGYPVLTPVEVDGHSDAGLALASVRPLPDGGRRAGLLSQSYGPGLKGASIQHHTGWLRASGGRVSFAPHTSRGFTAPFGVRTATLGGSMQAKAGLRRARRQGLVVGDRWVGSTTGQRHRSATVGDRD
jgi:hypothetical protein